MLVVGWQVVGRRSKGGQLSRPIMRPVWRNKACGSPSTVCPGSTPEVSSSVKNLSVSSIMLMDMPVTSKSPKTTSKSQKFGNSVGEPSPPNIGSSPKSKLVPQIMSTVPSVTSKTHKELEVGEGMFFETSSSPDGVLLPFIALDSPLELTDVPSVLPFGSFQFLEVG